ncbi:uncharacterized protein LOC100026065 isoform X2 [Monodelphis domestica]|uniref:uncharacterized protein LOC100026065 isoform X2 n=1 Tax=Monodelphis domestica TaxID=13616 RepID=UPI0024E220E2|nr:uncharacterized protein LOC100026065 isoform X2 [Monodelphis domestica]
MSRYQPGPQKSGSSSELLLPDSHKESIIHPSPRKIRDVHQHVFVLQERTLIAVPEDENVTPIILETVSILDESLEKGKGNALYLGIGEQNPHLCLCCVADEGQPTLKLENTLWILSHFILTTNLEDRCYYYSHFTDEEMRQSEVKQLAWHCITDKYLRQDLNSNLSEFNFSHT